MSPIVPGSDMFVDKINPSSKAKKKTAVKVGRNSGKTKAARETNFNSIIQSLRSQNEQQQKLIENLTKPIEQLRKDLENSADMHMLAKQAKIKAQECTKAGEEGAAETFKALASMIQEQTAKAVPTIITIKETTPPPQTPPKTVISIPEKMEIEEEKQKGLKRKASSSPPPKASTSAAAPTPQKGNDEPTKKTAIPPIVLKTPGEWSTVKRKLESNGIKVPLVKLMRGGLRIQTNNANEYRTTTKILEQDKHEYHTYSLPEDKLLSVVMRGIDMSVEISEIEEDLKNKGLEIKTVHRMKSYRTKLDLPLVIIQVPKSETKIWEIKDCCSYIVRIEAQRQIKNQKGTADVCTDASSAEISIPQPIARNPAILMLKAAPIARVYRGNPANQRDPSAKNTWRSRPAPKPGGQNPKPSVPSALPPPTQLHNTAKVQMSSGSPSDGSVFATGITVRETVQRQTFSPSTPAAIDISRQTYAELITDDPQLSKMRIVHLKQRNSQALTIAEQDLLTLVQTTSFCVPEPLNLQVRQLENAFPAYPVNTGFCFEFLQAVSSALASTRTFKNTDIVFSTLAEAGAQSQTVISRPITQANHPNIRGEQRPTSLTQEQPAVYGSAIFFDSQLMKEPGPNKNHATWCCINFPPEQIPVAWNQNRNARRNLPIACMQQTFQVVSLNGLIHRMNVIKSLVLGKR
ncbi:unnamed protein product [Phaedon cochleariae]|uniref:Pre-C2HC domain-containing protein n=1 Tax=Phaedon cochleariae TaxID=80249 RepID=A0A9N9SD02_PHACE|nr:unnamed protein product [Phaedon cochleariae]